MFASYEVKTIKHMLTKTALIKCCLLLLKILSYSLQNVVALAMLIRQFDFELAPDAPPVSHFILLFFYLLYTGDADPAIPWSDF